jgi:hypothetical protein
MTHVGIPPGELPRLVNGSGAGVKTNRGRIRFEDRFRGDRAPSVAPDGPNGLEFRHALRPRRREGARVSWQCVPEVVAMRILGPPNARHVRPLQRRLRARLGHGRQEGLRVRRCSCRRRVTRRPAVSPSRPLRTRTQSRTTAALSSQRGGLSPRHLKWPGTESDRRHCDFQPNQRRNSNLNGPRNARNDKALPDVRAA